MATARRRGKRSSNDDNNTNNDNNNNNNATTKSTTTTTINETTSSSSTEMKLNNALATVLMSKERTIQLHNSWRMYLRFISFIVVIYTIHSMIQSIKQNCFFDTFFIQQQQEEQQYQSQYMAPMMIQFIMDVKHDILAILNSFLLLHFTTFFVSHKKGTFFSTSWSYIISSILVLIQIYLFYYNLHHPFTSTSKCISPPTTTTSTMDDTMSQRPIFPFVTIFHGILTIAYWFMDLGMKQCQSNVQTIEKLQQSLKEVTKQNQNLIQKQKKNKEKNAKEEEEKHG